MEYLNDISWVVGIRSEMLTSFFLLFPFLIHQTFILLVLAIAFWATKNRDFYGVIFSVCFSFIYANGLKLLFNQSRPPLDLQMVAVDWQMGMPSGDAIFAAFFWLTLARVLQWSLLKGLVILIISLVMFSRVYLGVHTPIQVFAGLGFGILLYYIHFSEMVQRIYKAWFVDKNLPSYWLVIFSLYLFIIYFLPQAAELKMSHILIGTAIGLGLSAHVSCDFKPSEQINFLEIFMGLTLSYILTFAFNYIPIMSIKLFKASIDLVEICNYALITINILWIVPRLFSEAEKQ